MYFMKALEVCRHHDLAADDGVPSDGASERHQKMPRLGLGPAGHLWHRMLVVGFDRRGDVTKLRFTIRLIEPRSLASQRKAPLEVVRGWR
jgi:hypothetical protein